MSEEDRAPRSWIQVFRGERWNRGPVCLEVPEVPGRGGMQSLCVANPALPAWAHLCFLKTWWRASKGRNRLWCLQQVCCSPESHFQGWSSLSCSMIRAQFCRSASRQRSLRLHLSSAALPEPLVSRAGVQRGPKGIGPVRAVPKLAQPWHASQGVGGNAGDGHVLQAAFSSPCQAVAFGLARVLPASAPSKR